MLLAREFCNQELEYATSYSLPAIVAFWTKPWAATKGTRANKGADFFIATTFRFAELFLNAPRSIYEELSMQIVNIFPGYAPASQIAPHILLYYIRSILLQTLI